MHLVSKKNMLHAMHYKEAHWSFRSMATPSDSVLLSTGVALPSEMTEMWRRGELTDARLIVAGQAFDCHRLVLAANSTYFHLRFAAAAHQEFKDATGSIYLEELDAPVIAAMLAFFYEGQVLISDWQTLLQPLLLAASRLQAQRLLDACVGAVRGMINDENCEGILALAEAITRPDLVAAAERIMAKILSRLFDRPPAPSRPDDSITLPNMVFLTRKMRERPNSSEIALIGCKLLRELSSTPFLDCARMRFKPCCQRQ